MRPSQCGYLEEALLTWVDAYLSSHFTKPVDVCIPSGVAMESLAHMIVILSYSTVSMGQILQSVTSG